MSFDLKILVVNQKKRTVSKIPFKTSIQVVNEVNDYSGARYHSIWPFMTHARGIWYSLHYQNERGLNYATFCMSDFSVDPNDQDMPYWLFDKDVKSDLTPLLIKNEFYSDFENIVRYLVKKSPIKTIMVLGRYQGFENETICGTMTLDEYFTLMAQKKIYFNVSYILRES